MEWTTIIVALISALIPSGLIGFFTIREQKHAAKLANQEKETDIKDKEDSRWERLADQLSDQIEKMQEQSAVTNERMEKKDARITELEDQNAMLRQQLDQANTNYVKANLLKCTTLSCIDRKPPLGFTELTPEEMLRERNKLMSEESE